MVETVSKELGRGTHPTTVDVGTQVISVLTTGMYSHPLMVLREYVQNAVDGIDAAVEQHVLKPDEGQVEIIIDGRQRALRIQDNGIGVSNEEAEGLLCTIARSSKASGQARGFRGIGRLGGIGYCDRVHFETKSSMCERVASIDWDCRKLRQILTSRSADLTAEDAIRSSVSVTYREPVADDPHHFFRVELSGVHRFHKDELMSVQALKTYLSEIAPVPFNSAVFPLCSEVGNNLSELEGYRSYLIQLNGQRLYRPHQNIIKFSSTRQDEISDIEFFEIKRDGRLLGRGWYAKTQLLAGLPQRNRMRGIRIRQGNFEIGDERALEGIYTEPRFAIWHVGEIHLDYCMIPNARRDGFEQSDDYEAFLEQMHVLGRLLSDRCRASSSNRSAQIVAEKMLKEVEILQNRKFTVDQQHAEHIQSQINEIMTKLQGLEERTQLESGLAQRFQQVRELLKDQNDQGLYLDDVLDETMFHGHNPRSILHTVARGIIEHYDSGLPTEDLLERVLHPYLRSSSADGVQPPPLSET